MSRDRFRCVFGATLVLSESVAKSCPCFADAKSASYAVDGIGRGTGEMISDLDGSLGSRYFLNVTNERTCFASCARAFKSSGLISCLQCTSD